MKKYLIIVFFLAIASFAQEAYAAITFVQATSSNCGNVNVATCTVQFANPTTAGDFFVLTANIGAQNATVSATSTQSDTFTQAIYQNQTTQGNSTAILYAMNVIGGTTSITFTKTSTAVKNRISIAEYSGVATTNALDTATSSQGSASPSNSGSITPAQTGELLIGGNTNGNNGATTTLVAQNGFTLETSALCPVSQCEAMEDKVATTTNTVSSSFSWSSGSNWTQSIAAFLPATPTSRRRQTMIVQ